MSSPRSAEAGITSREREVWSLVAEHLTNQQIADRLTVSVRTVESHVSALLRKLQVSDRRMLARQAGRGVTAAVPRTRWPAPASSFVGREAEQAALRAAVTAHRMVTVTGPGGVGKTRLVLQVVPEIASRRRDGGWFVDLVHVTDPGMVLPAVATAVGVATPLGAPLETALTGALAGSDGVLVLDNCEHLADSVRTCAGLLLESCPGLVLVVTSRVRLRAPYECVHPVPGMSPTEQGDAVTLFVERARTAGAVEPLAPDRVDVLCGSLDGMALAIELAAARCPTLGLDGLVAGLDRGLRLLTTGAVTPDRHRSLRDTIAWSLGLLSADDREVCRALSVFASWFDAADAQAVTGPDRDRADVADALARLADHSLLVVAAGEPTRYRALEAIRQFGADQLTERDRSEAVHERHRRWCRRRLEQLATGPPDDTWRERLDRLTPDVEAALMHTGAVAAGRPDPATYELAELAELAELLAERVLLRGRPEHSQRLFEQAAARASHASERARLLRLAAGAAACRLVGNDTLRLLGAAASTALAADDRVGAAGDLAWMAIFLRWAPGIIAEPPSAEAGEEWLASARSQLPGVPDERAAAARAAVTIATALGLPDGDPEAAALATRAGALAHEAGAPLVESVAWDVRCSGHLATAELGGALTQIERRGAVLEPLPLDASTAYQFNDYLLMGSEVHLAAGHLTPAAEYADRLAALACYRDYPHPAMARRVKVHAMAGELEAAAALGERFRRAWERAGRPVSGTLDVTAYALAMVHGMLGDASGRAAWTDVTRTLTGDPDRLTGCATGWAPTFDAMLALDHGDPEAALRRLSADLDDPAVWARWAAGMWRPWYAAVWAEAAVLAGAPEAESRLTRAAHATRENPVAAAVVRRAGDLARGDAEAVRRHAETFDRLGCAYQRRRTGVLLG